MRLSLAAILAVSLTLLGCGNSVDSPTSTKPTPLASVDTATMTLARGDFCKLVTPSAIKAAAGSPATLLSWTNGGRLDIGEDQEVSQEFGCRWTNGNALASAWVFARAMDSAEAEEALAHTPKGCEQAEGDTFGSPSARWTCRLDGGAGVRLAGLVGDTVLTCEVHGGVADLDQRASNWCSSVLSALATS